MIIYDHPSDNLMIYIENNEVKGHYMPDLGEGLINAEIDNVGLELMKVKYSQIGKAVLPSDNVCIFHGIRMSNPEKSGCRFHVKADRETIKKGQIKESNDATISILPKPLI